MEHYANQVLVGDFVLRSKEVQECSYAAKRQRKEESSCEQNDVHVITQQDLEDHRYSIQDVVVPLISYDSFSSLILRYNVRFPQNSTGEYYQSLYEQNCSVPLAQLKEHKNIVYGTLWSDE